MEIFVSAPNSPESRGTSGNSARESPIAAESGEIFTGVIAP
ncbi:hypothetical protein [Microbispora rosea]